MRVNGKQLFYALLWFQASLIINPLLPLCVSPYEESSSLRMHACNSFLSEGVTVQTLQNYCIQNSQSSWDNVLKLFRKICYWRLRPKSSYLVFQYLYVVCLAPLLSKKGISDAMLVARRSACVTPEMKPRNPSEQFSTHVASGYILAVTPRADITTDPTKELMPSKKKIDLCCYLCIFFKVFIVRPTFNIQPT